MIKKIIAICVSAVMFFASGCALEVTGVTQTDDVIQTEAPVEADYPPQPTPGGTLNLSMRKPATLNPLLNEDATVDNILKLMFMQVAELNENMRPVPMLAEEINYASDGSNVLITLRDMNWSDGAKITAEDLVFSVNTLKSAPAGVIYKQCVENILTASAIDERTVKIVYSHAFGASEYMLCFPVIAQHYYKGEVNPGSGNNMVPMGNYIYNFDSYDGREHVLLSANNGHPDAKPYIQNIDVLIIADTQTDLSAYDQSVTDVLGTRLSDWGKYRGSKQTKIYEYTTTYFDFIGFNFNNPLLADVRVRQAIAHSIDLDKTVDDIYHISAVRTNTPICPQSWLYEPNVTIYSYDMNMAQELYRQVRNPEEEVPEGEGSEENPQADDVSPEESAPAADENIEPEALDNVPEEVFLAILVNEENEERVKLANTLADTIKMLGITVSVEVLPFGEYEDRLNKREYDIFVGGINFSLIPDLSFLLHSSNADSGMNFFAYKNNYMDMLLANSFAYATSNSYRNSVVELQKHIATDLPFISVCFRKSVLLTDKKIFGEILPTQSNIFKGIENWFIKTAESDS